MEGRPLDDQELVVRARDGNLDASGDRSDEPYTPELERMLEEWVRASTAIYPSQSTPTPTPESVRQLTNLESMPTSRSEGSQW